MNLKKNPSKNRVKHFLTIYHNKKHSFKKVEKNGKKRFGNFFGIGHF